MLIEHQVKSDTALNSNALLFLSSSSWSAHPTISHPVYDAPFHRTFAMNSSDDALLGLTVRTSMLSSGQKGSFHTGYDQSQ